MGLLPGMTMELGQALTAFGTIAGVLIPIVAMLIAHRRSTSEKIDSAIASINEKIEGVRETVNKRTEELSQSIAAHELEDERRFGEVRSDIDATGDTVRREFGETAAAIREHMHKIELTNGEIRLEIERKASEVRHQVNGRTDVQVMALTERLEGLDERVRLIQIGDRRQ